MNKYLEYYQFHEKDEDGNTVCLYCIVKRTDDGICLQFEKDYNTALKELKEFAYDNEIYTTEELKNSSKLHLQVSNKEFREELAKKYGYKTDEINNFNEELGISLIVPLDDNKINYEEVIDPNPLRRTISTNDGDENAEEEMEEVADFEEEKSHPIIEKLKRLRLKGIKKLAIRIGAIATIAVLGITGIKSCSKKGISEDLVTVESDTNSEDPVEYITQDPTPEENINAGSNLPVFQSYLNQSSEATRKYMTNFKKNLKSFNKIAKNYVDANNTSRLGLDTDNYTAFEMALLGNEFGSMVDNVSTYWNSDDLYRSYVKTNDQLKQLATVQIKSTGLANALKGKERQNFYRKYEDMIIDLNSTEKSSEKITKVENIFKQIKSDFNMDSENYNPKELFRDDSKYIAVMPMIRNIYDEAKNCGYDNTPSAAKMKQLSEAYQTVVRENIEEALSSITVYEDTTPSYEMYASQIALDLEQDDLYVIDNKRDIRELGIYKLRRNLPEKVKKVTPTPTATPTPTVAPKTVESSTTTPSVSENTSAIDESAPDVSNENSDSVDTTDISTPVYTTDDDNFEYNEEPTVDNSSQEIDNNQNDNDNSNSSSSESSIADQIIESDEGTNEDINVNDNNTNNTDTDTDIDNTDSNVDDNQIIESEEEIVNSMNDAINNGGYAETPNDWEIDDNYKMDGTDIIDGSVSDITIEENSDAYTDTTTEEVPTAEDVPTAEEVPTTEDNSQDYEIIESEESYETPTTDITDETTLSEENYETPVYEGTIDETNITEEAPTVQDESDITTYETNETVDNQDVPVEYTVAKLTQDQAIDQVISYNMKGMNAVPVFNATDNSWRVEVINDSAKEVKPVQYNI